MKKPILFDFDGVLCDSLACAIECTRIAVDELGLPPCPVSASDIGQLEYVTFPEIGRLAGVPDERQAEFASAIFRALRDHAESCQTFPGISEALHTLAATHTVGVVTANHPEVVNSVLRRAEADSTISAALGGDVPGHKAEKIAQLMEQFGASPESTWMIGDSRSDVIEGKKAGVQTLAVTWGWQSRHALAELSPTEIAENIEELLDILGR